MAFWGPALAAGASILSGGLGFLGSRSANKKAIQMSREQMAFQERMSSTAYERATNDMRRAGLNPMLAYQKGGASTPAGAQPNIRNELEGAANSARNMSDKVLMARTAEQNLSNARATNAQIVAQTAKTNAESKILGERYIQAQRQTARDELVTEGYETAAPYIRGGISGLDDFISNLPNSARSRYQDMNKIGDQIQSEAKQIWKKLWAKDKNVAPGQINNWIKTGSAAQRSRAKRILAKKLRALPIQ